MPNGNHDAAQPLDFGCNNLLGPLPEPDGWIYDGHPDGLQFRRQAITGIEALARSSAPMFAAHQMREYASRQLAAERERNAGWFALVMNAAAALEDVANCLRDPDAKRAAEGAAKHYRTAANVMWAERVGPNGKHKPPAAR